MYEIIYGNYYPIILYTSTKRKLAKLFLYTCFPCNGQAIILNTLSIVALAVVSIIKIYLPYLSINIKHQNLLLDHNFEINEDWAEENSRT